VHGGYRALDLTPLRFGRIARNEPVAETAVYSLNLTNIGRRE
jgi:hypothetical protein